jgi:hypothetical protein
MVRIDINFSPEGLPSAKVSGHQLQPQDIQRIQQMAQASQHMASQPPTHIHRPQQAASPPATFLTSEMILQYLLGTNEHVETLIMCKPDGIDLVTMDYNLYEALGSIRPDDNIQLNKMTKLLEAVHVVSFKEKNARDKPILKEQRVEELRKLCVKANEHEKKQNNKQ